ncbi:hypothetical protein JOE21_002885 [Desmospora profundinema]|uniref:Uncharacterized protein n=1 Tax=Desmospora profundinema TaxID=1571184 RepID=A0ABU1IQ28_9BACL|nr:hypothetical protein [Desmospora profundinema]
MMSVSRLALSLVVFGLTLTLFFGDISSTNLQSPTLSNIITTASEPGRA